jgi:class 3 adenylate cyclase
MLKRLTKIIFSEDAIIPWMMAVAITPVIFIAFFTYGIAKNALQQTIERTLLTAIQKKVEFIDSYISERKLDIEQLSSLPSLVGAVKQAEHGDQVDRLNRNTMSYLDSYLQHFAGVIGVSNMYVVNLQGKVIYTLNNDTLMGKTLAINRPDQAELYRAFDGAKILRLAYLSSDYNPRDRQQSHIYLSNPVLVDNRVKAIFIMKLNPAQIEQVIYRQISSGQSDETMLSIVFRGAPAVVINTHNAYDTESSLLKNPLILQLLQRALNGESGQPVNVSQDGKAMVVVYRYVPQLNMGMLISYDKTEIYQKLKWLQTNMVILTGFSLLLVIALVFWISRQLWQANVKTEQLLENILPKFVIDELKEKKQFAARDVYNVAIVFADIVNFTPFTSSTSPEKVVYILDKIFSIFEQLSAKYQLEKIKTIGDEYMAAAGLTTMQEDYANRAVDMALEMVSAIKHFNIDHHTNFALRVGVDAGKVIAGIIGKTKFSYDLWGNAVNRASRMESTGVENKVQITLETYEALHNKENYHATLRPKVMVKGFGEMDTYLIDSE